jgi:hypothetical protein
MSYVRLARALLVALSAAACFDPTLDMRGDADGHEPGSGDTAANDGAGTGDPASPADTTVASSPETTATPDDGGATEGEDDDAATDDAVGAEPDVGAPFSCSTFDVSCPPGTKCNASVTGDGGSWDELSCHPLHPDPVGVGEPCEVWGGPGSGVDDCIDGAICWDVDLATSTGTCVAYCDGTLEDPTCVDDHRCVQANGGVLNLCLPVCDPLVQDCEAGTACYPAGLAFACISDASGASGAYGDPCAYVNVCDPGLACLGPAAVPGCTGEVGCCTPFCTVESATCPGLGQSCVAWFDEGTAPLGLDDAGICMLP